MTNNYLAQDHEEDDVPANHHHHHHHYDGNKPWLNVLHRTWRLLFAIIVLIIFLPLLRDYENKAHLCCYVMAVMALYWMFEPINLYATSLIPVALFPLFGIAT